jgi:UrcA family protein
MKSLRCRYPMVRACVLAGSLGLASLVQADTPAPAPVPTAVVRYADLNLDTVRGVQTLYGRIRAAAREVCAPYQSDSSLLPSPAWRLCVTQAVETAVQRVDRPLLTAYHRRQEGHV